MKRDEDDKLLRALLGPNGPELSCEECFDELDAPVLRVTSADVPMPYAKTLEKAFLPQPEKVVSAVHAVLYR